jgi:plasmid stability protein
LLRNAIRITVPIRCQTFFYWAANDLIGRAVAGDCIDFAFGVTEAMSQIMIGNIDGAVIQALRRRAAACGTSMEEQPRRALTKAVGIDRELAARRLAEIRRLIGRLEGLSILDDLRHDRRRDDGWRTSSTPTSRSNG